MKRRYIYRTVRPRYVTVFDLHRHCAVETFRSADQARAFRNFLNAEDRAHIREMRGLITVHEVRDMRDLMRQDTTATA